MPVCDVVRTWRPSLAVVLGLALVGCYASHGLAVPDDAGAPDPPVEADAGDPLPRRDSGPADAAAPCRLDDPLGWPVERFEAGGDYDRAVAATAGVPWIAAREEGGNLVFLEVSVSASGIAITDRVELPDVPLYPVGFDTDGERFVALATTGNNWNGLVERLVYDRRSGALERSVWDDLGPDSSYTVRGGAALVGANAVLAAARADDDELLVELRDPAGAVVASARREETFAVLLIHDASEEVSVYAGAVGRFVVTPFGIERADVDPGGYQVMGGLGDLVVEYDRDVRIRGPEQVWSGTWPHTQISPPAVLRRDGERVAFSLQKELSGALGFTLGGELEWLHVDSVPGARGLGVALLPVVEERRLGLFYLGLEIPRPHQPLRYFGVACE